jgi:outer membrane receptor protein involved in Fe transport
LFDRARVTEFDEDPTLFGYFVPLVPDHRATAQVLFTNPRYLTAALQAQFVGRQFDDDQNRFPLAGYPLFDARVSRAINRNLEAFVGLQNLFDRTVFVGTNPTTIGAPRMVNVGVRVKFAE